jgi:transglutaminase-like putative cysteine protease
MEYELIHKTLYQYSEPVTVSHHAARMEPVRDGRQDCSEFSLRIFPEPDVCTTRHDYFGNSVTVFSIREMHRTLEVHATSRVSVRQITPPVPALSPEDRTA